LLSSAGGVCFHSGSPHSNWLLHWKIFYSFRPTIVILIPNHLHFIFGLDPEFGKMSFSIVHYLAVRSAVELNRPRSAYFHYQYEPAGEWWERTKNLVTTCRITPPGSVFGNQLHHFAHKSDVYRRKGLREVGGIYLDIDTISVKPLTGLLNNSFVIGEELRTAYFPKNMRQRIKYAIAKRLGLPITRLEGVHNGFCNAVLMSEKNSVFAGRWLEAYKSFRSKGRDKYWNEHSVKVPIKLAAEYPGEITLLNPYAFHYPLYDNEGLRALFEEVHEYPEAYLHHLWESLSWDQYLSKINEDDIRNRDTTYNLIARRFL